jgi:hypothetical protein
VKKSLIAALIVIAPATLLVAPAGAAVPSTKATMSIHCPNDSGGKARIWTRVTKGRLTKFAVDNPCGTHLALHWGTFDSGAAPVEALLVAPGTHFNWAQKRIAQYGVKIYDGWFWEAEPICMGAATVRVVRGYNKVLTMQEAFGLEC